MVARLLGAAPAALALVRAATLQGALAQPAAPSIAFAAASNDTLGDVVGGIECRPSVAEMWDAIKACGLQQLSGLPDILPLTQVNATTQGPWSCSDTVVRVTNAMSGATGCIAGAMGQLNERLIKEDAADRRAIHRDLAAIMGGIFGGFGAIVLLCVVASCCARRQARAERTAAAARAAAAARPVAAHSPV